MQTELNALCATIVQLQVDRKFTINLESKLLNTSAARIVQALGCNHETEEAARKKIWERALKIVRRAVIAKKQDPEDADVADVQVRNLGMVALSIAPIKARRDELDTSMEVLAQELPGFALCGRVRGFKALGLAVIVGEAGNLSNYATERKLWRRLGLGMAPGHEEHAYSTWRMRGGLTAADWTSAGYAPKRLGQIFGVVTTPLFMWKASNPYGAVYARRRERTAVTHPIGTAAECKADPNRWTKGHSDMDGRRVMTKAFVSDLWSEWRSIDRMAEGSEGLRAATSIGEASMRDMAARSFGEMALAEPI